MLIGAFYLNWKDYLVMGIYIARIFKTNALFEANGYLDEIEFLKENIIRILNKYFPEISIILMK